MSAQTRDWQLGTLELSVCVNEDVRSARIRLTAMLPFRSFWTTVNAGLPNRPCNQLVTLEEAGDIQLTKDLD